MGVQGLFDGTSIDASRGSLLFPANLNAKVDWFGTVTGRLGYLFSPTFLLYGKVGWGAYKTSLTVSDAATGVELGSASRTHRGLDAGVGIEWMFAPSWSLWVEWDRIFPDDKTVFFPNLAGGTSAEVRRELDKVLAGVNRRFGGIGRAY